jgi:type I restriction enzyme S subunit
MSALLEFIQYKDFNIWDVKQYLSTLIYSDYEIVSLGKHINAETTKVKPFESPQEDFKILGVNNKTGIFDNEIKKGSEINQPYKIVQNDFLAFNPYRINVGSIGLKTKEQKYNLISPAYVVFSCKKELLSEYLFLIFKTKLFNEVIRENTRGSVRQILAFDILETLKIPLPPLETQKIIVKRYQDKLNLAKQQNQQAQQIKAEIETYLYKELGIELPKEEQSKNALQFVNFKGLDRWDVTIIF